MAHTIKVDVKLGFIRWKQLNEVITPVMAGTPDELTTNSVLDGVLTLAPGKLYEIMKSANERGVKPVLELTVAEDPKPGLSEKKKDDNQTDLVLVKTLGRQPTAEELAPEEATKAAADEEKEKPLTPNVHVQ